MTTETLYLSPDQLIPNEANEKARPAENPQAREKRVAEMVESIRANGQHYPVLVVRTDSESGIYEYVDGGCRVEAVARLNEDGASAPMKVACAVLDEGADPFRTAVVSNLHRTQNSVLDMAMICREVREREGWKGKGSGLKVAAYLGIQPSRVSEYEKVLGAKPAVMARIESGEVTSLDAALKLMSVPADKQEEVVTRAAQIAKEEEEVGQTAPVETAQDEAAADSSADSSKPEKADKPSKATKGPKKIKAKHVAAAAREITGKAGADKSQKYARAKSELIEFFEPITSAAYGPKAVAFAEKFVEWAKGLSNDEAGVQKAFDRLADVNVAGKTEKAEKAAKTAKSAKAPKAAKSPKAAKAPTPKKAKG